MDITAIIPVYGGEAYLDDCIGSLTRQVGVNIQIIAVDDASPDGSAELIARRYPDVRLLRRNTNGGFARAVNEGMRAASHNHAVLLVNQDVILAPDCVRHMIDAMQLRPGIVGARLTYPDGGIQHAGGYVDPITAEAHHHKDDSNERSRTCDAEFVTGALTLIDRTAIEKIGLFDADLTPAYYEDIDYCFRARAHGFAIRYEPAAHAQHLEGSAIKKDDYRQHWFYHCGRIGFVLKHWPLERIQAFFAHESRIVGTVAEADYFARIRAYAFNAARMSALFDAAAALYPERRAAFSANGYEQHNRVLLGLAEIRRQGAPQLAHDTAPAPIEELTFASTLPFVARMREIIHALAGKWALRHVIQQQNEQNRILSMRLTQQSAVLRDNMRAIEELRKMILDSNRQFFLRSEEGRIHGTTSRDKKDFKNNS